MLRFELSIIKARVYTLCLIRLWQIVFVCVSKCYAVLFFRARHIRYLSQHQSVNGIWLIIVLMYVYTARTSFDLIRCVYTYDIDDNFMVI